MHKLPPIYGDRPTAKYSKAGYLPDGSRTVNAETDNEKGSHLCPVAIRINKILDERKPKSVEKALQLLISDLAVLPESKATRMILRRLQQIGRL